MIDPDDWLKWWRAGFVADIHKSWNELPWFSLNEQEKTIFYQDAPAVVRGLCNIPKTKLTEPDDRVLRFIDFSPMRQQALTRLFAALCNCDFGYLSAHDQKWCDRITKGIRPQSFLPAGIDYCEPQYHLSLLKSFFLPPVWSRLRLRFYQADILLAEKDPLLFDSPHKKRLLALFDSALWRLDKS